MSGSLVKFKSTNGSILFESSLGSFVVEENDEVIDDRDAVRDVFDSNVGLVSGVDSLSVFTDDFLFLEKIITFIIY